VSLVVVSGNPTPSKVSSVFKIRVVLLSRNVCLFGCGILVVRVVQILVVVLLLLLFFYDVRYSVQYVILCVRII
jgi:hypothetical protein